MPAKMDIGFWLDYFKRIHADALCITAGGVVAFYPTQHPISPPQPLALRRPIYFRTR